MQELTSSCAVISSEKRLSELTGGQGRTCLPDVADACEAVVAASLSRPGPVLWDRFDKWLLTDGRL